MNPYLLLTAYCIAIFILALVGGYMPFLGRISHGRLQFYLSLSAGVMLGASFFHVMPDAMRKSGDYFGWWMALGVVGLFCIERFIAPHSHEIDTQHVESKQAEHDHAHANSHEHHHEHSHATDVLGHHHAAAPAVAGWMAVLGLTIHTFMNGFGLAAAVQSDIADANELARWAAGFSMFLAIFLHKPADALAISTVLTRKGVPRRKVAFVQLGFVSMVPVGVIAYYLARKAIPPNMEKLLDQLTGFALAFSAGTFLFVALSDLLPEVQFHRHDRIPLFLALTGGVLLMGFIAVLEGQHEHEDHEHAVPEQVVGHDHGDLGR